MSNKVSIEISKKLVVINTAASLFQYAFSITFLVWLQQYLLHRISPEEYSLLPLVNSLIVFTPLVTTIFTAGIGRYLIEAYAKGSEEQVIRIISSVWPFIIISSIVLSIVVVILICYIHLFLNIPDGCEKKIRLMLGLATFSFLFTYLCSPFLAGFSIKQKFYVSRAIETGIELFRMALLFFLLTRVGVNVLWVIVANTIASVSSISIQVVYSRRMVPSLVYKIKMFDLTLAWEVMRFGLWSFLGRSAYAIRESTGPILLNLYSIPLSIATFNIGSIPRNQIEAILPRFTQPIGPVLIAMHAKQEKERLKLLFFRMNKYLLWLFLLFITPAIVFRTELIVLYIGNKYIEAGQVLGLLLLPTFIALSLHLVWPLAYAVGKINHLTIISIVTQMSNLILAVVLLKYFHMGAVGSALAVCLVGIFFHSFFTLPCALSLLHAKLKEWFLLTFIPGMVPALVGSVAWFYLKHLLSNYSWLKLACCFVIGGLCYLVCLYFCLSKVDKEEVVNIKLLIKRKIVNQLG